MLACRVQEVFTPELSKHCVGPPPIVLCSRSFDEACPFEPVDESTCAAVREDALCGKRLDAEPPVVLKRQAEQNLVLGMAEA